ncbi:MAG TPA: protein phosphatase 2C domain-containing protein [Pyrinomonadaceae bacterium]|nr:protein phosphatase 2C domain-containing protein [Pyrinomonadaceae bacterium]
MLIVEIHATSHIGRVRKGNEDNYLVLDLSDSKTLTSSQEPDEFIVQSLKLEVDERGIVLAVSDGMGGALAGEVASQMAVETVSQRLLNSDPEATLAPEAEDNALIEKLYDATIYANHLIHHQGRTIPEYNQMGATFTAVGITPDAVDLLQVGDSRAYLVRNVKIFQITKDQSLVQQLIDSGQISAEEADHHPLKNVILQALGAQNEVYPVPARLIPQRDDILVICSDGLSNKIGPEDMLRIVIDNIAALDNAAKVLVKEANERGGEDNITLIVAKLTGSNLVEPTDDTVRIHPLSFGDIHDTADQDTAEIL